MYIFKDGFRPSNWADRLAHNHTIIENNMITYKHVYPVFRNGIRQLCIEKDFEKENPDAFKSLIDFANNFGLIIEEE